MNSSVEERGKGVTKANLAASLVPVPASGDLVSPAQSFWTLIMETDDEDLLKAPFVLWLSKDSVTSSEHAAAWLCSARSSQL